MMNTNYKNFIKRLLIVLSASLILAWLLTTVINKIIPYSVLHAFYPLLYFVVINGFLILFKDYILNDNKKK